MHRRRHGARHRHRTRLSTGGAAYHRGIKALVARLILTIARYRAVGDPPRGRPAVLVAAPHTSNWDFFLMLAIAWHSGINVRWIGKKQLFRGPMGPIMRALGGISVDRDNPGDIVGELASQAKGDTDTHLVVPVEGTRSKGEYWKSGFHRIASDAGLPIGLTFLDHDTRTGGFGPVVEPTDDLRADMDQIRAFYADKGGVKPKNRTEPRLRAEEPADDGTAP